MRLCAVALPGRAPPLRLPGEGRPHRAGGGGGCLTALGQAKAKATFLTGGGAKAHASPAVRRSVSLGLPSKPESPESTTLVVNVSMTRIPEPPSDPVTFPQHRPQTGKAERASHPPSAQACSPAGRWCTPILSHEAQLLPCVAPDLPALRGPPCGLAAFHTCLTTQPTWYLSSLLTWLVMIPAEASKSPGRAVPRAPAQRTQCVSGSRTRPSGDALGLESFRGS